MGISCHIQRNDCPMPYAEASPASLMGNDGSKCANTGALTKSFLASLNALVYSFDHLHALSDFRRSFSGCNRVAKVGMNL